LRGVGTDSPMLLPLAEGVLVLADNMLGK
jgi:hypothetical protein